MLDQPTAADADNVALQTVEPSPDAGCVTAVGRALRAAEDGWAIVDVLRNLDEAARAGLSEDDRIEIVAATDRLDG